MARDFDLAKLLTDNGLRTTVDVDVSFDSGTLFVDADTNRVGIATTTPSYNLEVNGSLNSTSLYIGGTQVTSTATELNLLDGVTATTAEINYLDGVTSNIQTQIDNISSSFTISDNQGTPNTDTVTTGQTLTFAGSTGIDTTVSDNQVSIAIDSTVATLTGSQTLTNKTITSPSISDPTLTGTTTYATLNDGTTSLTATVAELNTLDGITATTAELNYTDGVTSNIQTQLDAKIEGNQTITLSGDVSGSGTTSISVTVADDSHNHIISNVDGLQTALDLKAPLASPALTGTATAVNLTVSGNLTVNGTTFTNNADNLLVDDALIELNHSLTGTNASDLGIVMERGTTGDNAFMGWDETNDRFILGTTTATGASTGSLTVTPGTLNIGTLQIGGTSVTATAAELNILDGVTATASELNALDGITATVTELNYTDGVTSNIQTQLDAKLASSSYTAADVLTKIKTVDGAGSGLDADLLDGQQGSYYYSPANPPSVSSTFDGLTSKTSGTGTYQTSGDFRAPIFYDSNNTAYYTNPAGLSNLNELNLGGLSVEAAEYGPSFVGNFGQWQAHNTYASGFNVEPSYWGWSFINGSTGGPNSTSSQWYRARLSLGDAYGKGTAAGDYWLEFTLPRYSHSDSGQGFIRSCENGTVGGWTQLGSKILGTGTATNNYRAPIFYDSNNTAYYADFSSTGTSINTAGNIVSNSDINLKENIETIPNALSKVLSIRGVTFNRIGEERRSAGVIAQEVEQVLPEVVTQQGEFKSVAYGNMVGLLIEAIKEQQSEIEELKKLVKELINKS